MAQQDLIETFVHLSDEMRSASASSRVIRHQGRLGTERESQLEAHLLRFLPERYAIGRGEVVSAQGTWSRDEDLILYDRFNSPKLFTAAHSLVLPVESVAAVVEVKSSLGTKEIRAASQSIASVKALKKQGQRMSLTQFGMAASPPRPVFGALFAYGLGVRPQLFFERWTEAQNSIPPQQRIDLACVLGEFVIFNGSAKQPMFAAQSNEHSLLAFTMAYSKSCPSSSSPA